MCSPYPLQYVEEAINIQSSISRQNKQYSCTDLVILSNISHWLNLQKTLDYCFTCLLENIKDKTLTEMIDIFDVHYLHNIFHLYSFIKLLKT